MIPRYMDFLLNNIVSLDMLEEGRAFYRKMLYVKDSYILSYDAT